MKWIGLFLIAAGVILFVWVEGHKPPTQVSSPVETQNAKANYLQKANHELDEWSAKVKQLEERAQASGSKSRARLDEEVKQVQGHVQEARKDLKKLSESSEDAFSSFRRSLENTMAALRRDYHKALAQFKEKK